MRRCSGSTASRSSTRSAPRPHATGPSPRRTRREYTRWGMNRHHRHDCPRVAFPPVRTPRTGDGDDGGDGRFRTPHTSLDLSAGGRPMTTPDGTLDLGPAGDPIPKHSAQYSDVLIPWLAAPVP